MVLARLSLNNMRIIWKNFSGAPDIYNKQGGKQQFHFVIEPDMAQDMLSKGWPVKQHVSKEGEPYWTMKCNLGKFEKPMFLVNVGTGAMVPLAWSDVGTLDNVQIDHVDADVTLNPCKNPRSPTGEGVTVYLAGMYVYKNNDRFTEGYDKWKKENQTPPPPDTDDDADDLPF